MELIQNKLTPTNIKENLEQILNVNTRSEMLTNYEELKNILQKNKIVSKKIAREILQINYSKYFPLTL